MNKLISLATILFTISFIGCSNNVSKSYSLTNGQKTGVVYGKLQYTTSEKQEAFCTLKNEETGKSLTIKGDRNSSIREFVIELEPGKWKIEKYGVSFLQQSAPTSAPPSTTGNKQIDDFQRKQFESERALLEQKSQNDNLIGRLKNKKSPQNESWNFNVVEGTLSYVGTWDIGLDGKINITNEKDVDDLTISEDYKNLNAKDAIMDIPIKVISSKDTTKSNSKLIFFP